MSLTTLPTKLTKQISKLLETRTPNTHAVLRTCLRPENLQVLSPLLIPITLDAKTREDTLKATFTPADANDKTILRRLRRGGLLAHPRVDVTVAPIQDAMRTISRKSRDAAVAAASVGPMDLPEEVLVDCWDTVGVFFADHLVESGGLGGNALPFLEEKDQLIDTVLRLLLDRKVNIHVNDRCNPFEMVAGGRRVGVVRVLLLGKDEEDGGA